MAEGVSQPQMGEGEHNIWPIFFENCIKINKIRLRWVLSSGGSRISQMWCQTQRRGTYVYDGGASGSCPKAQNFFNLILCFR